MSYHVIYIYTSYFGGRHHISCSIPLCVSKSIQTSTRSPMIRPNGGRSANSRVHLNGFNRSSLAKLQRSQHFSNISWSGKNSEMTAVKLFQSKTMDKQIAIPVQTLWPIFVSFRPFSSLFWSQAVMAAWVVRMWQGFISAWRMTGPLSAESLRPGSQEPSAVQLPKLAAPSAGRERLRRLTSSNVISRQHGTFQGTGACIRKPVVLSSHFASCRGLRYWFCTGLGFVWDPS